MGSLQRNIWERANAWLDYFTKVLEDNLKAIIKPQYVDQVPKAIKGNIRDVERLLESRSQLGNKQDIMDVLGNLFLHSQR